MKQASSDILLLVARGDEEAFGQLFNTHWDRVFSTAMIILKSYEAAEDVAQEVFLKFWNAREKAAEIEDLNAWLFITTRNLVYSRLRRMKLEEAYLNLSKSKTLTLAEPGAEQLAEYNELKQFIEEGINNLPSQQQIAFRLSREKGLTHEEIGAQMGISPRTVKDYIVKALAFLRTYLSDHAAWLLAVFFGYL